MFWLILTYILLAFLLVLLFLRLRRDRHVKKAREEMPGKVVVLTNASSPLGEALARTFYSAGAKLVLVGPSQRELEATRIQLFSIRPKNIPVYQPEVVPLESNVTEFTAQEAVAEITETCGQVDILINNAVTYERSDILSTKIDDDVRVMNLNYFSPLTFTKAILPGMVERKSGKIVFINSVAGKIPIPFRSSFAAAQHALQAFGDTLRAEMAIHNISVLISNPEYIPPELAENEEQPKSMIIDSAKQIEKQSTENVDAVKQPLKLKSPTQLLAEDVLNAVLSGCREQMPFSFRFSYWLSVTCPLIMHTMLAERTKKAFSDIKSESLAPNVGGAIAVIKMH